MTKVRKHRSLGLNFCFKKDIGLIVDVDIREEGFVSFSMEEESIGAINHPDMYGLVDLKVIKGMQSKHSIALYEFISDYLKIGKKRVYLDDFKVLMGIDPQTGYKRFCDLNSRVITPAIQEINEKTSKVSKSNSPKKNSLLNTEKRFIK